MNISMNIILEYNIYYILYIRIEYIYIKLYKYNFNIINIILI